MFQEPWVSVTVVANVTNMLSNMIYVLKSRIPPKQALLCLLYLNEEKLKHGMTTELFFSIFCSLKNLIWKKRRI